jgi:hypothetical protein
MFQGADYLMGSTTACVRERLFSVGELRWAQNILITEDMRSDGECSGIR